MSDQGDLLEYGARLRDAGMAIVVDNNPSWHALAYAEIVRIARFQQELHTDDLLPFCLRHPAPNKYAMGPVWMRAVRQGILELTDRTRRSSDPIKHSKRMPIYRSLIQHGGNHAL